jgi:hypothetical protein
MPTGTIDGTWLIEYRKRPPTRAPAHMARLPHNGGRGSTAPRSLGRVALAVCVQRDLKLFRSASRRPRGHDG